MFLSTSNILFEDDYINDTEAAFSRCFSALSEAGFERVDINFWGLAKPYGWMLTDRFEKVISHIGELSEKYRLPIHQTHGNTYTGKQWDDPDYPYHGFMVESNLKIIKATAALGGSWVVMHPMNLPHDPLYDPKRAKEAAIKALAPYIEEARKCGVGIAVENMVDFRGNRRRYCGGDIYELIDLVDTINDPSLGICLDTGHANISGADPAEAIRAVGKRLKATHINDNHAADRDEHILPYFGTVDWQSTVKALKEIGYEGDFAYEVAFDGCPREVGREFVEYSARLGRYLLSL
ncbi:MAG: sugar phosphate isomerase/epimerase [Ruminococcaceae bacterium]|nr:sugar phosphate isomerase/epimerase [Oscillospiraceae bacterium]